MKNGLISKGVVFGIIVLFLGVGVIQGVLGNNSSLIDSIPKEYIQKNHKNICNESDFLISCAGEATVTYITDFPFFNVDVTCCPDDDLNYYIYHPTTIHLLIILRTNLNVYTYSKFNKYGYYELRIKVNGKLKGYDITKMHYSMIGEYSNSLGVAIPLNVNGDETLEITIEVSAWPSLFRFLKDTCVRNVIVDIQLLE